MEHDHQKKKRKKKDGDKKKYTVFGFVFYLAAIFVQYGKHKIVLWILYYVLCMMVV